ncbi:MAG: type IV toxin-antitoxin system AbiEi family antitoxin domain-containing protein [Propionibacteriaceae bacterium]|jgi:predicted transcriptional regulator of viral defense system|nr:type IV toxin-antitoxin system AbiEi family antitoxin domain-containing protein [Propionibacteriaceae bacterium]
MAEALTSVDRLREIALEQHGFVTARQAYDAGVSPPLLAMMVRRGRIDHVSRGVYRLGQMPVIPYAPLMQAVLWTGFPEACLSHESALDAWDISDINPDKIHVTVGAKRRVERVIPARYVIHREDLTPPEMTWWESIPIVTAGTAIRQCLETGVPTYLIRQALERSARTGLVPPAERDHLTTLLEARYDQ